MAKKILVLGGRGFVGAAIAAVLKRENNVTVVSRSETYVPPPEIDVLRKSLEGMGPGDVATFDIVINAAGELYDSSRMASVHIEAPTQLLRKMAIDGKRRRWIQVSSVGVYGRPLDRVVTETYPFNPIGSYEETKAEGEISLVTAGSYLGIPVSVLRPSNVFGEGMPNRSLSSLILQIARGHFFSCLTLGVCS